MNKYSILKNIRILYVEDDENIREQFLEILEIYTDTVYVSNDGREGLSAYEQYLPDLVITDIRMPGLSGLEMATAIKELNPEQPVLITTAFSDAEFLIEAVEIGVDGYIIKPINITKLLDSLCDVAKDLLLKRKLKQESENFHIMMDSNPNMMMMLSIHGVNYINYTMQNFLAYQPSSPDKYDDFCLFDYIQTIDKLDYMLKSRKEFIQYFLDNPDSQHILSFKTQVTANNTRKTKYSFVIAMTHQKNTEHYIFSLANITELANENLRLEYSATTDKLTGIANRAMFEQVVERYIDRKKLQGEPFVLIFFDIDHFKSVNDNFGHDEGDQVLQNLTQLIENNIRDRDFFARWGGEEFILLLNHSTLEMGMKIAENLRQLVEKYDFNPVEHLSCSFSVVEFKISDTVESLLKRADIVLYRAKAAGRNCVKKYEVECPLNIFQIDGERASSKHRKNQQEPLILIADDDYMQRLPMRSALEGAKFRVEEAENGIQALELFQKLKPDLVILDVVMPEMDGFEACRKIRKDSDGEYLPILMLTGLDNIDSINQAYHDGATDFLTKPINWTLLGHKIQYLLRTTEISKALASREVELLDSQFETIQRLAKAAEYRDSETGNHIIRMSQYSFELAKAMGLSEELCNLLLKAAPMHDVGKIGIPDNILLKPGKLSAEEFEVIKTHTTIGAELLSKNHSFVMEAAHIIALTHHEKWDGSGYPNGLAGEKIPVLGRICAIADVFDALTTERPYKKAWETQAAFKMILDSSGTHFDPQMAEKFVEISARIIDIKEKYRDEDYKLF